jgi:hypothetical protein
LLTEAILSIASAGSLPVVVGVSVGTTTPVEVAVGGKPVVAVGGTTPVEVAVGGEPVVAVGGTTPVEVAVGGEPVVGVGLPPAPGVSVSVARCWSGAAGAIVG